MKNFRETLNEEMKNPEFKKEWDSLEPEFNLARKMLDEQDENLSKVLSVAVALNIQQNHSQR